MLETEIQIQIISESKHKHTSFLVSQTDEYQQQLFPLTFISFSPNQTKLNYYIYIIYIIYL